MKLLSLVKQDSHVADSGFRVKNRLGTYGRSSSGEKQLRVADLSAKVPSELKQRRSGLTFLQSCSCLLQAFRLLVYALASSPKAFCTEKDHNFLPPIVNLIISRRLDHQRLKLLDAFRAPIAGESSPDEHDDAADENSYEGGYNHRELTILDEHMELNPAAMDS
ncbi:hypothetical protein HID58_025102 [Brassica napus]|uniref:Uncharacterized protein n=1 Tax=Brassica napus TaxID=3708 RepID=A0ABQ8CK35_BRANA|nr:hypothetical protein HID58_025102 [Brassica napus]